MLACAVRSRLLVMAVIWAASGVGWLGCATIDPGPDVGPPASCDAPGAFFVTDVWPKFFVQYGCAKSDCHDAQSGHGYFRLQSLAGVTPPDPASPVSLWPMAWQENYRQVTANLSCASPTSSPVLTIPAGQGAPHPGGIVVTDIPGADALFNKWLQ